MGIAHGYPRLQKRFGKLVGYIQLIRPFTLLAPLLAGFFGVLTPVKTITMTHVTVAISVGMTLSLAQAAGQCMNQCADAELDKLVKPYRAIPAGLVSREEALGITWLVSIVAAGVAFIINTFFGFTILALLFFAISYSVTPLSPRKVDPLLNTGWTALSRGFFPIIAVLSVYGSMHQAYQYSILAFLWVMGFQASKDVLDVEGDRKYGIKTIPNTWGVKGLLTIMIVCMATLTFLSILFNFLFMLILLPPGVVAMVTVKKQATFSENTYSWVVFYLGLGLIYVLMFIDRRLF